MSEEKNWVQQPKGEAAYNDEWKPTQVGETIEGTLIKSESNIGQYNKNVYDIKVGDKTYSVWGTKVLDGQLAGLPINSYIKIEYLGKKAGKGNAYHDFNVFVAGEQAPAPAPQPDVAATDPALNPPPAQITPAAPVQEPVAAPAVVPAPTTDVPVASPPATSAPPSATQEEVDELPF